MINATIVGDDRVRQFLESRSAEAQKKLSLPMGVLVVALARKIKEEKLSGQVLNSGGPGRTGRLRRSISPDVTETSTGVTGKVSTNVEYASAHEYGFKGTVTVKEHLRMQVKAFGRPMRNPHKVIVRQHSANMNLPARSFMRTALDEMRPRILEEFKNAVAEVMRP